MVSTKKVKHDLYTILVETSQHGFVNWQHFSDMQIIRCYIYQLAPVERARVLTRKISVYGNN